MSETVDHESLVGLINQLAEVPVPEPVSMVPQTPGWAVLAVMLVVVLLWLGRRWQAHHHANAYRRAALTALEGAGSDPAAISAILKRAAIVAYGRTDVAALTGADWRAFLNRTGGDFSGDSGAALVSAAYVSTPTPTGDLNTRARHWIRQHPAKQEAQDD